MKAKKYRTLSQQKSRYGWLFISPWLIGTVMFFLFPLYRSLLISFFKILNVTEFTLEAAGLTFYQQALFDNTQYVPLLMESLRDLFINVPLINVFSLFIALLISREIKGRAVFRVLFFLPVVLGTGFIMQQLLGQNVQEESTEVMRGILMPDVIVQYMGNGFAKIVQEFLNRVTLVLWSSGVQILIYLSGLRSISGTIYEAAKIDSASEWECFWLITLPMLSPIILMNIIYTIIDSFASADNVLVSFIVTQGITYSKFELSSAMGWMYFLVIAVIIAVVFLIMKRPIDNVSETGRR